MLLLYKLLCIFALFLNDPLFAGKEPKATVLARADYSEKTTWHFQSSDGFTLSKHDAKQSKRVIKDINLRISIKAGKLYCNGKRIITQQLRIIPASGSFDVDGKHYVGIAVITHADNQYTLELQEPAQAMQQATQNDVEKSDQSRKASIRASKNKARDYTVRVLLDEQSELPSSPWILQSSQGFLLSESRDAREKKEIANSKLAITVKRDHAMYMNNKPIHTRSLVIQPRAGTILFNGNEYSGSMLIIVDEQGVKIINCIGLEEYVESVLCTESWPGWPLEVNKVFAIASRTYVIAMVQRAKTSKSLYHVRNTNKHQTYQGGTAPEVIKQAVKETEGVFLTYNNQPITAMFDACCGGIIPSKMSGHDFHKAPYLARSYPCTFCNGCRMYAWQATYDTNEFITMLKKDGIGVRRIRDCKVTKKDKAGIVQEVTLKGHTRNHHLSGKKIYSLCNKKVKSISFSMYKDGDTLYFEGVGLGHQLGLCQWGAREMVRQKYDYKSILLFYYPGTQLMRLN